MHYWLVMPAAGTGHRFGEPVPKQYYGLCGRTVIEWALAPFLEDARCAGSVVALSAADTHWERLPLAHRANLRTVQGGAQRCHSVRNGLAALESLAAAEDWVLVHDAARPCLTRADLDRLIDAVGADAIGGLLAVPVADTLKHASANNVADATVDRSELWRALTPQMFRYGKLCAALDAALRAGRQPTDEAQALEWTGARVRLCPGSPSNIKITSREDAVIAGALLHSAPQPQPAPGPAAVAGSAPGTEIAMRVGTGVDVHAFGAGDFVMLGGVRVPHSRGIVAHSDGDVILHALCDAMLGASGLGDIGQHFRDDDPRWRGADSSGFVRSVLGMLKARDLRVANVDVTLLAEAPRLSTRREEIRKTIAELLEVDTGCVNVKATTTERLGFLGRGEGIAAQAIVLLATADPR
jgi:2-C-methyl-D-erythritol 4-phosphate cytidylyltransferase/2-C-methyl-D-erythritol 2,4-cyclodiphosphate synthase